MIKQKRNIREKGITLVALIITIIVLLILSVVAIQSVNGDGIISHAKNARDKYAQTSLEEQEILSNLQNSILNYSKEENKEEEAIVSDKNLEEQTISATNVKEWTSGEGTQDNPYIIASKENLAYLAKQVNSGNHYTNIYFKLEADIDMSSTDDVWIPIGNNSERYFDGNFDGMGSSIVNLGNVTNPFNYRGLFGFTGNNSKITNLTVEVGNLGNSGVEKNGDLTGGIIGYNKGIVENCNTNNMSIIGNGYVGGITGYNSGTIKNCFSTNMSIIGNNYVGGIAGYNKGKIIESIVENSTTTEITGKNDGTIE